MSEHPGHCSTRRQMLLALGGGLLPLCLRASDSASSAMAQRYAQLRALISNAAQASRLGAAYRSAFPSEARPDELTRLICADLNVHIHASVGDPHDSRERLASALERCARAQFGAGDTVAIGGWIMARTEARICALCG